MPINISKVRSFNPDYCFTFYFACCGYILWIYCFYKKSIAESTICVQSVEVNDESLLGTLLTYIIPLIGFFFSVPKLQLDI